MKTVERLMEKFLKGESHHEANIHTDGQKIYSYSTVLIAYREGKTVKVNTTFFSSTTTRQVNAILRELYAHNNACTGDELLEIQQFNFSCSMEQEDKDYSALFLDDQVRKTLEEHLSLVMTNTLFSLQHKTKQAKNVKLAIRERKVKELVQEMFKKVTHT